MNERLSVLIVDDDTSVLDLLGVVLPLNCPLNVVGAAADASQALASAQQLQPDVIVLDHMMPGMTGAEVAPQIRMVSPNSEIVFFTAYFDDPRESASIQRFAKDNQCEVVAKGDVERLEEALGRLAVRLRSGSL